MQMAESTSDSLFDQDPERYDALIDWSARLKNEAGFYRRLFERIGVERVLDTACGTGRHAAMFHSWGLAVEGADLSAAMIDHCRQQHGESARLRWVQRSFAEPHPAPGTFDAVLCIGNSLALAQNTETIRRAVASMLAALRPGGVCVIQVLNLWRLPDGPTTWQKCRRVTIRGTDCVLIKGVHRAGSQGFIDLIEADLTDGAARPRFAAQSFLGLEPAELQAAAAAAGGETPKLFGSIKEDPYARERSADLIVLCRRALGGP
jgi:SAM-dependent methyltransferase